MQQPLTNVNHFGADGLQPIKEVMGPQTAMSIQLPMVAQTYKALLRIATQTFAI
jgi:hypothetical protein